jgi:UDP:flavonoid glycosyltransferase YjiC (YdhE family)
LKILVATLPADGHLNPMLPLARALAEHHEVVFAGAPCFEPMVNAFGFRQVPAGKDWLLRDLGLHYPSAAPLTGEARTDAAYRYAFIGGAARQLALDLVRVVKEQRADIVLSDAANFAGGIAAEAAGVPHAQLAVASLSGDRRLVRRYLPLLDDLRALVGLPPDPQLLEPWRYLLLSSVPRLFYGDADLPPSFTPVLMEDSVPLAPPTWLAELPPRPTVYATLGTIQNRRPEVFAAIADGLAGEDLNLVMTTGANQDPAELGPVPKNARVERFLPQLGLLPVSSAVICHGGSGTLRAAAWFGLPMVLIPISADQPANARIFEDLGCAVTVPVADVTPDSIRTALRTVLNDLHYRENATVVSRAMRELPRVERAVALIESLRAS